MQNYDFEKFQHLTRIEVEKLISPLKDSVKMTNERIWNLIGDIDTLVNRVSLCEVYAQIEAGDYEKWTSVL